MKEYVWEKKNLSFERTLDDHRLICLSQQQLRMDPSVLHGNNLREIKLEGQQWCENKYIKE